MTNKAEKVFAFSWKFLKSALNGGDDDRKPTCVPHLCFVSFSFDYFFLNTWTWPDHVYIYSSKTECTVQSLVTLVAIFSLVPLQEKEKKEKKKQTEKKCDLNVNSYHFKCTWIYLSRAVSCVIFLDLPATGRPAQSHLKERKKKKYRRV